MDGEKLTGATAFLVLGVALTALFLGFDWFWIVFVVGYAVVLPLVGILTGADDEEEEAADAARAESRQPGDRSRETAPGSKADALELLRERYARGELDDEQFDRKLDRLLKTETLEDARDAVARSGDRGREPGTDRDRTAERE